MLDFEKMLYHLRALHSEHDVGFHPKACSIERFQRQKLYSIELHNPILRNCAEKSGFHMVTSNGRNRALTRREAQR